MRYLLLTALLLGCGRTPPAPPPDATVDAAPASTANPIMRPELPAMPLNRLHGADPANHMVWVKDFGRQEALTPPAQLRAAALDLVPPGEAKLVAVGFDRGMALTRLSPGRQHDMVRIVTTDRGPALRAAIARHLERLGYAVRDRKLRSPMTHPTAGVVMVKITETPDLAARVEFNLTATEAASPAALSDPAVIALLKQPVNWLNDEPITPLGHEFGHYHAVRFAGAFTHAQRLAYAVRTEDVPALKRRLIQKALRDGYQMVAQEGALLRTPDGRMFTTRALDDAPGVLVLHLSARWPVVSKTGRPRIKPKRPDPTGKASATSTAPAGP